MHELHVKIVDWAFMFIHVAEQVQLSACSGHFSLWVRNRERGQGRSNETNNLDLTHKLWGARDKKMLEIHVWKWCRRLARCVCASSLPVLFQSADTFLVDAHAKFCVRLRAAATMWSCAGMHRHMNTHALRCDVLSDTHVYYHGWCWGKGLVAGRRSRQWDFMANAKIETLVRDRGLSEVQKQREPQMDTLDKQRNNRGQHHRVKRNCMSVMKSPEIQQTKIFQQMKLHPTRRKK